jgi:ATPase subunit of ABC transporter with duplicated ATPase domains
MGLLEGYQYESKIKTVLHGLNFTEEEFDKPINDFSGGQKTVMTNNNDGTFKIF